MKSLCLFGRQELILVEEPMPEIKRGQEVLLEVAYCGICGSDIHEYMMGPIFCPQVGQKHPYSGASMPICMGHEYSGVVKKIGPGVKTLKSGDRVCVDIAYGCEDQGAEPLCHACSLNYPNACARLAIRGLSAEGGGFCQYVVLPEKCLHVLPESVPLDIGALIEPIAISWHAVRMSGFQKGQTALVIGAGPIGLAAILALQGHSAGKIIVTEPGHLRRQQARDLGADHVLDPTKFSTTGDLVATITQLSPPYFEGVDVSFDCGGVQETLDTALNSLRLGGTAVNLAVWPQQQAVIFPMDLTVRERKYMGSMGFCSQDMDQVINAFATGQMSIERAKRMITSKVSLETALEDGFINLSYNKDKHVKVLVEPNLKRSNTNGDSINDDEDIYPTETDNQQY